MDSGSAYSYPVKFVLRLLHSVLAGPEPVVESAGRRVNRCSPMMSWCRDCWFGDSGLFDKGLDASK